ncbi:MAG: phosphate ABC transporter permease PstA [Sphingobacteriales bacterium]|nr:MAG: phosphate ABC transporter permease PstA [Sphingobacteriales bacterium]
MSSKSFIHEVKDKIFRVVGILAMVFALLVLVVLLIDVASDGGARLSWDFLVNLPSRRPQLAGILTAWVGTIWIMIMTAIFACPIGIAAGIYLQEYGKKNRWASFIEINIANLAGVPSIIYGLLGLELFVRALSLGESILTGGLTLSLLILPIIIVSTREAIKAVPYSLREASYAMGASKWQTIWHQVLPAASGGILTGIILSLSRAIGETAPLIVIGALTYVPFVPSTPMDSFTVLPIQVFNWVSRPQQGFVINAAAGIIVLLILTLMMNGFAIYLRHRWQKKVKW